MPLSAGGTSLTLSIGDKSGSDEESGVKVDGDVRAVMSAATDPVETWSWVALLWCDNRCFSKALAESSTSVHI